MLTNENVNDLLTAMCECEPNIKCVPCKIKERHEVNVIDLNYLHETVNNNQILWKQNKAMKLLHGLHLDALNNYYHALHKECPCRHDVKAKCHSPWLNKVRTRDSD